MKTFEYTEKNLEKTSGNSRKNTLSFAIKNHQYEISLSKNSIDLHKKNCGSSAPKMPFMVAILPNNMQEVFSKMFFKAFHYSAMDENIPVIFNGNLEADNIFNKFLKSVKSIDQLPDILITYGLNNFYHENFLKKLLTGNNFDHISLTVNSLYKKATVTQTAYPMSIIGAETLVMVADKTCFSNKSRPNEWYELLNPAFRSSIAVCNNIYNITYSIYLTFIKNYGLPVIDHLSQNICSYMQPEDMLSIINQRNPGKTSIYVMPYSYASQIKHSDQFSVIWPNDGAIVIPIQMLIKRNCAEKYKDVIQFITSSQLGDTILTKGLLPANCNNDNLCPCNSLNWLGWDFINDNNIHALKRTIKSSIPKIL